MPTINDRIGSQNVIRVLANASAPPTRLNNLTDVDSAREATNGLILIWSPTGGTAGDGGYLLGNDIAAGLNISGITTINKFESNAAIFTGVTTSGTLSANTAVAMGSTTVITAARQLQNIASLDETTTATIETAIANAPNTFTNLNITGVSTFQGQTGFVGVATFGNGLKVESGVSTFIGNITGTAGLNLTGFIPGGNNTLNVVGHTELDRVNVSAALTANAYYIGASQIVSAARQLQNIASLDATTTATIESAVTNAPNTFTNLEITGISTFVGPSGHVGLSTFGGGIDVVAGVTTFREDVQFKGAAYDILWDQATSKFKFNDSAQAVFGSASGGDLKIYHQSGNSTIKNETGQFRLAGNDLRLQSQDSSEDYLLAVDGGSVSVFFNDVKRLETSSSGVNVTDTLNVAGVATVTGTLTAGLIDGGSY